MQERHLLTLIIRNKLIIETINKLKKQDQEIKSYKSEIKSIKKRKGKQWTSCKTGSNESSSLAESLREVLEDPITFLPICEPVLTPSGHTVDIKTMRSLISGEELDPFSREETCTKIKKNYLVKQIMELF